MEQYNKSANIKYITKETTYKDETGEHTIQETEIYKKHYGGKFFYRVWLSDLLNALGLLNNNKELDILFYVLDNMTTDNNFIGTYRSIAEDTKISLSTVTRIFKKMNEVNLIRKIQNGVYKINPALILQGDNSKKRRLIIEYENIKNNNQEETD